MAVQASHGRVTAVAKRSQTNQLKSAGVDWQIPSSSPSTVVVIPGVPEGEGARQLVVTNPSATRASVAVQVLGFQDLRAERSRSRSTFHLRALQP